ncbi:MAG: xylulokinase [Candidatus Humimicrobiaceae bacterium]
MKYLAGIDIGTTGAKAAVFDLNGNLISSAYREYVCDFLKPGWVEQDPDLIVDLAMEASKEAIKKENIDPKEIASLGISSQRCCTIFVDKFLMPIRPMISWQDSRTSKEVEEILEKMSAQEFYKITGFPLSTTWMLSKILWFRKNEPEKYKNVFKILQLQDYSLLKFGVKGLYNDVSDAGFSGIWDTNNFEWSEKILNLFDIDKNFLPEVKPSGIKIGEISREAAEKSGFAEGTSLSIGAGDQNSAAIGAGIVSSNYVSVSMGTAGNANAYLEKPFRDPNGKTMVLNHAIYGKWAIEGHQAGAAGVLRWFRDEIATLEKAFSESMKKNVYSIIDELIEKAPAGSKGLIMMPFFAGANAPRWNSNAKGSFVGLTFAHDRSCIARSVLEGITLEMKDILNAINNAGVEISNIRIMGGASKSKIWRQIQADIYGVPVETLKVKDAAILGAAILGGTGFGFFKDIYQGVEQMIKTDIKVEPIENNLKIYKELYETYCLIYKGLNDNKVFEKLNYIQSYYY